MTWRKPGDVLWSIRLILWALMFSGSFIALVRLIPLAMYFAKTGTIWWQPDLGHNGII